MRLSLLLFLFTHWIKKQQQLDSSLLEIHLFRLFTGVFANNFIGRHQWWNEWFTSFNWIEFTIRVLEGDFPPSFSSRAFSALTRIHVFSTVQWQQLHYVLRSRNIWGEHIADPVPALGRNLCCVR